MLCACYWIVLYTVHVIAFCLGGRFSGHVNVDILCVCAIGCSARPRRFYRAMHFSAKRGIAIACRLSVRLSVCLSVTLVNSDHIGWNSSKIIS